MKEFENRVAFITGGEKGLGRELGLAFANAGAKVVVFGIDSESGEATAKELCGITDGAMFIKGDVTVQSDVKHAMEVIEETYGGLDFAVNNAGISGAVVPFLDLTLDTYDKVFDINVKGTFICMQEEIRLMSKKSFGRVVNVASEAAFKTSIPGLSAYSGSKVAVKAITSNVACEFASKGINVNAIAPGAMLTTMSLQFTEEQRKVNGNNRPSNRRVDIKTVANLCAFLCSEQAKDIVGITVPIDGGKSVE